MRIRKGVFPSSSTKPLRVIEAPYVFLDESQVTVNLAAVSIFSALPAGSIEYGAELRNVSTGGQRIRIGSAPTFAGTPTGVMLLPGDSLPVTGVSLRLKAIADVAGGLLDRLVFAR